MSKHPKTEVPTTSTSRLGERGTRKKGIEGGTVVEVDGKVKVKWDRVSTSYYRRGDQGGGRMALSDVLVFLIERRSPAPNLIRYVQGVASAISRMSPDRGSHA